MDYDEVKPVGNTFCETRGNMLFYETKYDDKREFAWSFGMVNGRGANADDSGPSHKATVYLGHRMIPGAGPGWALNWLTEAELGAPARDVHGAEGDLNINNMHYGNAYGAAGLAAPRAWNLDLSGYSQFNSTGCLHIHMGGPGKYNRGIVIGMESVLSSGLENHSNMTVLINNLAHPEYVLRSLSPNSKMQVDGPVGFGIAPITGFAMLVHGQGHAISQSSGNDSVRHRYADFGAAANRKYLDHVWDSGVFTLAALNDNGTLRMTAFVVDTSTGVLQSPPLPGLSFASDALAAAGGVPIGGIYHNTGAVRVRLT